MEIVHDISLWIHIIAGHLGLLSGTAIMIMKKGNANHVKLGKLFFYSMLVASFSSIILSMIIDSQFLLHIGIFTFFLAFGGWRSVKVRSLKPAPVDIFNLVLGAVNGFFMIQSGQIILMVFGGISILLVIQDLLLYYKLYKKKKKAGIRWLSRHIGMMIGAYIAAFTAFLVVNVQINGPSWLLWLAPTFIFIPLMRYWTVKFTKKKSFAKPMD